MGQLVFNPKVGAEVVDRNESGTKIDYDLVFVDYENVDDFTLVGPNLLHRTVSVSVSDDLSLASSSDHTVAS